MGYTTDDFRLWGCPVSHHPSPPPTGNPAHHGPSSVLIPSVHFHVYLYLCVTQRNYTTFLLRHFSFGYLAIGFTSLLHFCGHPASASNPQKSRRAMQSRNRNRTRNPVTETLTGTCASPAVRLRLCLLLCLCLGIISSLRVAAFM